MFSGHRGLELERYNSTPLLLADPYLQQYNPEFDGAGARKNFHVRGLISKASAYSHVFVIVHDNDALSLDKREILHNVLDIESAVWSTQFMFMWHMKRKGLAASLVQLLKKHLGNRYKNPRPIKRNKGFCDHQLYQFEPNDGGYAYECALILSLLENF